MRGVSPTLCHFVTHAQPTMHVHTSNQHELELGFGGYRCNWGVHICGFYETERERDDILLGFLHTGVMAGDLQLYCPHEQSAQEFEEKYGNIDRDAHAHLHDPACFQLYNPRELYYPDGVFSPWAMDRGLQAFYAESQCNGPRNVRATAEMSWALTAIPGVEHFMAYESRLNYFIPGKPWISICLYDLRLFPGHMIMKALQTHPYTICKGVITQNPYYQDPDKWLADNAPEFLGKAAKGSNQ